MTGRSGDRRRVVRAVFEDAYNYMKSGQLMRQVVNKINEVDFNNLSERQHFGDIYEQILNDLQSAGNAGEYYTPRAVTAFMVDRIDPRPGETLFDPACGTGGFLTCSLRHMRDRYVKRPEDEQTMQAALRAVEKKQLPHMLCVTNMLLHGIEDPGFVRHDNTLARPYIGWGQKDRVDIVLTNPPFGGKEEDGIESNFPQHFRTKETADLFLALIVRLLKPMGRAAVVLPDGSLFGEGVKTRLKEHLMEECNLHTIVRLPNSVFRPYASIGTNLLFFEKGEPTGHIWFYEHLVPEGRKAYSMTRPIRLEHLQDCSHWWGGAQREGRKETERAWKVTADEIKARAYNLDIKNPHTQDDDHGDPEELLEKLNAAEAETKDLANLPFGATQCVIPGRGWRGGQAPFDPPRETNREMKSWGAGRVRSPPPVFTIKGFDFFPPCRHGRGGNRPVNVTPFHAVSLLRNPSLPAGIIVAGAVPFGVDGSRPPRWNIARGSGAARDKKGGAAPATLPPLWCSSGTRGRNGLTTS